MALDINELSAKQIIMISGEDLQKLVGMVIEKYKNGLPVQTDKEIPARLARRMLKEKGYKVKSDASFISFVRNHNLTRVFKGREYWYQETEINNFPSLIPVKKTA